MLEFSHVTKHYDSRTVLDDVTFDVKAGWVTGLVGPNGSGKTTLARILLGLAAADSGSVRIDGLPYTALDRPGHTVGTLFESVGLHPTALLGRPQILVLDEPANGLDPEGIRWLRNFLRSFADLGGTVLVTSHQLAELARFADDVVVISQGRVVDARPIAGLGGDELEDISRKAVGSIADLDAMRTRNEVRHATK